MSLLPDDEMLTVAQLDANFGMMETEGDVEGLVELIHFLIKYQGTMGITPEFHKSFIKLASMFTSKSADLMERICKDRIEKHRENVIEKPDSRADPFISKLLKLEADGKVEHVNMLDSMASNIAAG